MSSDSSQEKTQDPTSRRLRKAREQGQVARSRELMSSGILLFSSIVLTLWGPNIGHFLMANMQWSLQHAYQTDIQGISIQQRLADVLLQMVFVIAIPLGVLAVLLFIAGCIPGGMVFNSAALAPKFSKMNPITGLGRLFTAEKMVDLGKALGKCLLVMLMLWYYLASDWEELIHLSQQPLPVACEHILNTLNHILLVLGILFGAIALLDVPYQQWLYIKNLRMSKQEVKEERRNSEGQPEIKKQIRKAQVGMARARLNKRVPKADVVLLNPTHYAVAICYNPDKAQAPYLLAKGQDEMAMRIRELAMQHNKVILTLPELTRAIYFSTQIDQEVPAGLYTAVAYVLSHVMQMKAYREGRGKAPDALSKVTVPTQFQYTERNS